MATSLIQNDGAETCSAPSFLLNSQAATERNNPFADQFAALVGRRAGVIEVAEGRPLAARPRWLARRPSQLETWIWGALRRRSAAGDHCWLYFHQPRRFPNFLVAGYAISTRQTSLATIRVALGLLDLLAQRKGTDALLCDATSRDISDRALARWGWEPLAPSSWHRLHIKRFYGHYEVDETLLAPRVALCPPSADQLTLPR